MPLIEIIRVPMRIRVIRGLRGGVVITAFVVCSLINGPISCGDGESSTTRHLESPLGALHLCSENERLQNLFLLTRRVFSEHALSPFLALPHPQDLAMCSLNSGIL